MKVRIYWGDDENYGEGDLEAVPRVGEGLVRGGEVFEVEAVYHDVDEGLVVVEAKPKPERKIRWVMR